MRHEEYWQGFSVWATGSLSPSSLAVDRARAALIDTVACILSGLAYKAAQAARTQHSGPAEGLAFYLATAAHAEDFDDYDLPSVGHPSAVLIPVVLALGSETGATGADALTAYIVGLEAMDRMGEAVNPEHYEAGWHATSTLGGLGAAAAAGRLLGLTPPQMLSAISIAAGMASGMKAQFATAAKPLNMGFAARTGITAARLAHSGADASPKVLGLKGFAGLMSPAPRLPLHLPGQPLAIEQYGLVAKPYPCCGYVQRLVAAAVDIGARAGFEACQIETIAITAPKRNAEVVNHGIPDNIDAARFSAVYCVAASLVQGSLGPEDFTESAIRREQVLELARRTTFSPDEKPQGPDDLSPKDPDRLVITMVGGEVIDLTLSLLPGGKDAPLTSVQMRTKFDSCARKRLTADDAKKLEAVLDRFEDQKDISGLPTLMGLT